MKKVFTLVLVMAMAITSFAQVKGVQRPTKKDLQTAQKVTFTGMEAANSNCVASTRSIMVAPEETQLSFASYDWQTNAGSRTTRAVWPDGYAVICYTMATDDGYTDRGTGLAIWDPAVGEWEFTEERVETVKTGWGSIARYKENGLVLAAHTATECKLWICEDFRTGNRDFGEPYTLDPTVDPTWPTVQCSGENLDIIHMFATSYGYETPYSQPSYYFRFVNGAFEVENQLIEPLDENHVLAGGADEINFLPYDPARPNRVSFTYAEPGSDGKLVISEDNGQTWSERIYFQRPTGAHSFDSGYYYPRWVNAAFDEDDNLSIVFAYNMSDAEGHYLPGAGGVSFWSEILPKHDSCVGGIGNVGEPFIMDSLYIDDDLYSSCWYWSNAIHCSLPEHFGQFQILDGETFQPIPHDSDSIPDNSLWLDVSSAGTQGKDSHGHYNSGTCDFPSMVMDGDRVFAFWSMLAGDSKSVYFANNLHYYRLFGCVSEDRGRTWLLPKQLLTGFENELDEMVYGYVIPYIYTDGNGEYVWYVYMNDMEPGTVVQNDETVWDNNYFRAVKVYLDYVIYDVEESPLTVATTVNVYPNPAQGSFKVSLNNQSNVNIYNAVGQLVKTYNNVSEINVNLEAGVYFVNAGNQTVKVVVK